MKKNVGGIDRTLRLIAGVILTSVGFYFQSWWIIVGLVLLVTGGIGWCPAYLPFGFSSCESEKKEDTVTH